MIGVALLLGGLALCDRMCDKHNCPPLTDLSRFPDRPTVDWRIRRYVTLERIAVAKGRYGLDSDRAEHAQLAEQYALAIDALDALDSALNPKHHTARRRYALRRYRELVGPEQYATGMIP